MCYGLDIALSTLNSCRCLHEPKTRFPVGRLFPFPRRESHPLKAPGLPWRTGKYHELLNKVLDRDLRFDVDELEQAAVLLADKKRTLNEEIARQPNAPLKPELQRQLALLERVQERVNEACVMF